MALALGLEEHSIPKMSDLLIFALNAFIRIYPRQYFIQLECMLGGNMKPTSPTFSHLLQFIAQSIVFPIIYLLKYFVYGFLVLCIHLH